MLPFLLACVPAPEIVGKADSAAEGSDCDAPRLSAELTAIPTVVRVAWTTDEPADQVVLYAQGSGAEQVTEVSSGTDHVVLLTGLHALEEVSFRVAPVDGEPCGDPGTIVAGSLPAGLPTLRVSGDVPDAAEGGFTLVPIIQSGVVWVVGIDAGGSYVWAWPMPGSGEMPVTAFRAALSMDGRAVLVNATASSLDTPGNIYRVALDLSSVETIGVLGGHTDFVERAPREYTTIGWDIRTLDDGRKLLGDTLVEVDADGSQRVVWDAFDWLNVDYAPSYTPGFYLPDPEVEDWSHVNGLDYDADLDAYHVSIGGLHGIARVDRADDAMRWYLSDDEGDFTNAGDRALVECGEG